MINYSSEKPEGLCRVVYIRKWNMAFKAETLIHAPITWLQLFDS